MTYKRKKLIVLPERLFRQKIEAQLAKVINAVEVAHGEAMSLSIIAEDQTTALDNDPEALSPKNKRAYNLAEDVLEWAQAVEELLDGVDTGAIRAKLKKATRAA